VGACRDPAEAIDRDAFTAVRRSQDRQPGLERAQPRLSDLARDRDRRELCVVRRDHERRGAAGGELSRELGPLGLEADQHADPTAPRLHEPRPLARGDVVDREPARPREPRDRPRLRERDGAALVVRRERRVAGNQDHRVEALLHPVGRPAEARRSDEERRAPGA